MSMELLLIQKTGQTAVISLNAPNEMNALSAAMLSELAALIDDLQADSSLRAVIITGTGKAFCAGANVGEMSGMYPLDAGAYGRFGNKVFLKLENLPVPVIAAINGYALGGGLELALACDIRLASEKAKLSFPETKLGIIPGFGGTQRLSRLIGPAKAKELIFTAEMLSAEQSLAAGLVNAVSATPETLMDEALALADRIAANSPVGVKQAKLAINKGFDMDLTKALDFESEAFSVCFSTYDQKEAMSAFVNRQPHKGFIGR